MKKPKNHTPEVKVAEHILKEIREVVGYVLVDLVESGETVPVSLNKRQFSGKLSLANAETSSPSTNQ